MIGDACRHLCGEERLVATLRSLFSTDGVDASRLPLHALLVRLARHVPALYTTNFDDLLENAFAAAGRSFQAVVDAHDLDDWRFDEHRSRRRLLRKGPREARRSATADITRPSPR